MSEASFLHALETVIRQRLDRPTPDSYTAKLARQGCVKVAQKLGEEAVELALAAAAEKPERVTAEAADVLYHLLLLLAVRNIPLSAVMSELEGRHRAKTAAGRSSS